MQGKEGPSVFLLLAISTDFNRYDGGRSEQVLDAAWRMFFDAQGPNQPEPETEDDIACQLEYINVARIEHKRRAGEAKERTAYSTYQTRYLKYGRNNR